MGYKKVQKFLLVKQYSQTQNCYFYLSNSDGMVSWKHTKKDAKKFNTVEGIMIFLENEKHIDAGSYEVETVIEKT